ncbi:GAF domain-containing sensor histidine kinase [Allocoleopsis franciscana]|uniref:histidine kinase n=1 Tax=Allocoleopsis franciscana PCC 7113 TaxID=1173027 RepID=K9WEL5_9CYAN|nr:GAF domain-containing sensor histidine kinase [Allocoleopsis franciscana]AFZ18850.1 signal transduction histidine kinase [Allocoleopsis franciscana PCC 7113]
MLCSYPQLAQQYTDKFATFYPTPNSSKTKGTLTELKLQQAISQLCLRALAEPNLSTFMVEAVALISQTLDVKYCSVLELLPDRKSLVLRAGIGFPKEAIGAETVGEQNSLTGYTLRSRQPVIVEDWQQETRLCSLPLLQEYDTIGSISTVIEGIEKPFGVLSIHATEPSRFTQNEVNFIQTSARILAAAIARQQAEAQLVTEKLNRLQNSFLNAVSDELRAPIFNIKMALQMLAKALNRNQNLSAEFSQQNAPTSKAARCFEVLQNECKRELKLINDLLDLRQLEAGTYPNFLYESISLLEWIPPILESLHLRVEQQRQILNVNLSAELPPLITEPTMLKRILLELLDNACKYTPSGETITVAADVVGEKIRVSVSNSGVEIPAQECDRIFDKFYRIPSNDFCKQGGMGLGLALVKQLVERLGSTIQLDNGVGQTTFVMELPVGASPFYKLPTD